MGTSRVLVLTTLVYLCRGLILRKDIDSLTSEDTVNLRLSLQGVKYEYQLKKSYSYIASFYGYPTRCSVGNVAYSCSVHGMPTFPQWHRLYLAHLEQALTEKGGTVGIPYWDWSKPLQKMPAFLDDEKYNLEGEILDNPWHHTNISLSGVIHATNRTVDSRLWSLDLMEHIIHALEYPNYCQFVVQLEVLHSAIHFLVGGASKYSMSNIDFAAYDPLFLVHHANLDRIYEVYEALYRERGSVPGTSCETDCEICDIKGFQMPLEPFNRDDNPFPNTRLLATGWNMTDKTVFDYNYDSLTLNGLGIADIKKRIEMKKKTDRAFAVFKLNGIQRSVNLRIQVCKTSSEDEEDTCESAGDVFILGGSTEHPWMFRRPYYHDITKAVLKLGLKLDENFRVLTEMYGTDDKINSSEISPQPSVEFRPAVGKQDAPLSEKKKDVIIRQDVDLLTEDEMNALRVAMENVQNNGTQNGYQAIAAFHGAPGQCPTPNPDVALTYSCSIRGLPSFPHWHRLFVMQLEDSLGLSTGIPYWDWTKPGVQLPNLVKDATYQIKDGDSPKANPFYDAAIEFLRTGSRTSRSWPEQGVNLDDLKDAVLLALEQDNFCDFEVQFEIAHNLIHALVGGNAPYGMSSLEYSAYDPIFYIHHSFLDKIWSIWMSLQELRGKPYKAHCAQSYIFTPLSPFNFSTTYNPNPKTYAHSTATNIYDHEKELGYTYDTLTFDGMNITELEHFIRFNVTSRPRMFVGVLLNGFNKSAKAEIHATLHTGERYIVGRFAVLGGPTELGWRLDRLYKVDITKAMFDAHLSWNDLFELSIEMFEFNGVSIETDLPLLQLIYQAPEDSEIETQPALLRKNIQELTDDESNNLRDALKKLQSETSADNFENIAGFHGAPNRCPPHGSNRFACSPHGLPIFPHWHRLLTVQFEQALSRLGASWGIPYWDWTDESTALPKLFSDPEDNPFYRYYIQAEKEWTDREVNLKQLNLLDPEGTKMLFHSALSILEEDQFCDFAVQFELLHYRLHALMGGTKKYSLATLDFSAFDPLFMILQSSFDRLWTMWQQLQYLRQKPVSGQCVYKHVDSSMEPFRNPDINVNKMTRENSLPGLVSDHRRLGYKFDKLNLNVFSLKDLEDKIKLQKSKNRTYAGLMLGGVKNSVTLEVYLQDNQVGTINILGGPNEKPWVFERPYKIDVTDAMKGAQLTTDKPVKLHLKTGTYDGSSSSEKDMEVFIIERPSGSDHDILVVPINKKTPPPALKVVVKKDTQVKFVTDDVVVPMKDFNTFTAWKACNLPPSLQGSYDFGAVHPLIPGNYYMSPADVDLCNRGIKIQIFVEEE
ncbi:Hemocyanin [Biomphalaria glabrata]|uniref:Hemocyanin 1-like isoform X1 n=1 Tax=Biomphalaria glabrata TaxID=6526 RepID=A0A9W3B4G0_BIOGL|nr:hemocyanin 1-like isoform X1 [Biomphalaria glabrata]KAI8734225.1 Hemocyanin [Biomphalaria glabrata]